ncbi:MAG: hypothetical protein GWP68_06595 [Verrucomicrobiaceae bacterium]|nr:hypothetical protein [Verrucomicrobiaceae bacterium]
MNYSKSTQNEIGKYLNAVRKNMQHAPEEEVEEVILHLQEQIDVALEESGDTSNELDHIKRILSTMSHPESFAISTNKESRILQWGVVALLAAVVSWGFNLGAVRGCCSNSQPEDRAGEAGYRHPDLRSGFVSRDTCNNNGAQGGEAVNGVERAW